MSNLPAYSYQPIKTVKPFLRTYSLTKARLIIDSMLFRAKEYGEKSNNIHVSFISLLTNGFIILHFKHELPTRTMLFNNLNYNELVKIENGQANLYRKNFFTNQLTLLTSVPAKKGVLTIPQKLIVKLTDLSNQQFDPDLEIYPIQQITEVDIDAGTSRTFWDTGPVITSINEQSKWVVCLSELEDINFPNIGVPSSFPVTSLTPFENIRLAGGNGFPPLSEIDTGPTRSLIHINYSEDDKGHRLEVNTVYEWKGDSSTDGKWGPR